MPVTRPRYRLLSRISTNAGRTVHVAETDSGQRVLVKQADTAEWAADLAAQARHFRVMGALLGPDSPYPPVLDDPPGQLVLPFYEHGSLDDLTAQANPGTARAALAAAMSRWMKASRARAHRTGPPSPEACRGFLATAAQARLARLDRTLATPAGRLWARQADLHGTPRGAAIDRDAAWLRDPAILGAITAIGPRRLPLAGHGDFALGNLLLTGPPEPTAGLVFIDVQGLWHEGYPWWDPVADLAILIAYSCQVRPALARAGELPAGPALAPARPAAGDIADLAAADPGFAAWAQDDDPYWRARLEIAVAIRLLGNVSVQLATAPANPGLRAAVMLGLYTSHVQRIRPLIGHLRKGTVPAAVTGNPEWAAAS